MNDCLIATTETRRFYGESGEIVDVTRIIVQETPCSSTSAITLEGSGWGSTEHVRAALGDKSLHALGPSLLIPLSELEILHLCWGSGAKLPMR